MAATARRPSRSRLPRAADPSMPSPGAIAVSQHVKGGPMAEPRRHSSIPPPPLKPWKILIVEARYYEEIGAVLMEGSHRAIEVAGAAFDVIRGPGALEIPI